MRDLKFRAWDKEKKIMIDSSWNMAGLFDDVSHTPTIHFDGVVVLYTGDDGGKNGLWEHEVAHGDRFVPQQYTGLKDKNDKDEYHFDITRNHYGQIRYIDWYCGAWWLMFPDGRNDKPLYGNAREQEIVGNIMESPELLEVKQ